MEIKKKISMAVIRRLPRYFRYLSDLDREGIIRISSGDLSKKMNVTASQIRQDLNCFGGFGQQGYGYSVKMLLEEIGKILGTKNNYKAVIVGAGNMGHALANYHSFDKRGYTIVAVFDNDSTKIGTDVGGMKVLPMSEMTKVIQEKGVEVAIITVPRAHTKEVAEMAVDAGVRALWNFSPMDLKLKRKVAIENVHLSDSLMVLGYHLTELIEEEQD